MQRFLLSLFILISIVACSESTGVPEVDRARDALEAEVGSTPALRKLGDTASQAAQKAARAGETGDMKAIGSAVGQGSVDVLCAGNDARKDAGATLTSSATASLSNEPVVVKAADAYRNVADKLPSMTPCPQPVQ